MELELIKKTQSLIIQITVYHVDTFFISGGQFMLKYQIQWKELIISHVTTTIIK